MTEWRWERREKRRTAKRARMKMNGRGLITVINQLEQKRARELQAKEPVARRAAK